MVSISRRKTLHAAAALSAAALALPKAVAQSYPDKTVKIIVPYGTGTVSDWTARFFAKALNAAWGAPVVVENMTGAGGVLGTQAIAKAVPDGYTLGVLASNHSMNAALYRNLSYDPVASFSPIIHTSFNQFAFCVNASLPVSTLGEFIALAKAKPGEINFGSSGNGGSPHMAVEMLAYMAGIKLMHIPYRSNGAAVVDLVSGQVSLMSTSISALLPHIKSGRIKALAVSGDTRSPLLPEVPTAAEAGVAGYNLKNWNGIVGPANLPAAIVSKVQNQVAAILREKSTAEQFAAQGVEIEVMNSEGFGRRIQTEADYWRRVAAASGVKVE